jgi:hypothetical protein
MHKEGSEGHIIFQLRSSRPTGVAFGTLRTSITYQLPRYVEKFVSKVIPKVESADDPSSFQKFINHNAHNPVIVAATHWGIWMRHNNASGPPWSFHHCIIQMYFVQRVWVVYAAIECRIIVYRR